MRPSVSALTGQRVGGGIHPDPGRRRLFASQSSNLTRFTAKSPPVAPLGSGAPGALARPGNRLTGTVIAVIFAGTRLTRGWVSPSNFAR